MIRKIFVLCLVLGLASMAGAQDPEHVLSITSATTAPMGTADVANNYTNTSANSLAGWSWGNCIVDPSIVDITAVEQGSTTMTINGGMPPAFIAPALLPGAGWTVGVVINFFGDNPLPPGSGYELHVSTYTSLGPEGNSDICYCDTLGTPPVETTLVDANGASIVPTTSCGNIAVEAVSLIFRYTAPDQEINYPAADVSVSYDETVNIEEDDENDPFPNDTAGFSMGLSHPAGTTVDSLDPSPLESALGVAPAFFGPALLADGWTVGVVYDFFGMVPLAFDGPIDVITASYTTAVDGTLVNVDLAWSDSLGSPPVENTVVVGSDAFTPDTVDGRINLNPVTAQSLIRGDCNSDSIVNIADGIHILNRLFQGQAPLGDCEEACDSNGDGAMLDASDAIYIFNYRFLDGPPPPAPFPNCGTDMNDNCNTSTAGC